MDLPKSPLLADGVLQIAFVVEDIAAAMPTYSAKMGAGPWFLRPNATPANAAHRGRPVERLAVSLAFGYAGETMIELIQVHDDQPSAFREVIEKRGYGLHHLGIAAPDFDRSRDAYLAAGYEIAFSASRLGRVAIFDTLETFPFMLELLEINPAVSEGYARMKAASVGWDGVDPVRIMQG